MKSTLATFSLLAVGLWTVNGLEPPNRAQIKAVLIAGSNGYDNYRHQADVCHAYQILIKNGIPKENIIVMMYDDIANNTENPSPGVIINRPDGPDVYGGVQIDYSGSNVNKTNFFHVLKGNKEAMRGIGSSRVLESGPQDNVFINFVDHGGPGILLMPDEEIAASEFLAVLENMHSNSRYAKLFLYIEACESGSMFDNLLPDNLNIFVMTAADPHESSYACFYDEKRQTYLGDVFSVTWMEISETDDLSTESVNHQFQEVRTSTNTSHVEEYGDIDIGNTKVSDVIGFRKTSLKNYSLNFKDAVSNHHVSVAILGQKISRAKQTEKKEKLQEELHNLLQGRKKIESVFISLLHEVTVALNIPHIFEKLLTKRPSLTKSSLGCYENMTKYISEQCFSISNNRYVASHLHKIINLCNNASEDIIKQKLSMLCNGKRKLKGIN